MLSIKMTNTQSTQQADFKSDSKDDEDLVRAAQAGDLAAFESLYRIYKSRIYAVLWRICGGQTGRAEDLLQESFIRAWQALSGFRFQSAFATWLYRLSVNTALDDLRDQQQKFAHLHEPINDDDHASAVAGEDTAGIQTRSQLDLERAIAQLPARARAILILHDVEGWKHEEIASSLDIAVGSSKAHLHRARQLMIKILGERHE